MPLSDLIRTLNAPSGVFPKHFARSGLDQPFASDNGRVFLHYANIRLDSQFLPIVESATGKLHGHAASIQAVGLSNRIQMTPASVFVLPTDDDEFVYLDRLVRTLHALNYLTQPQRGNLLLKVHARHILSVPAHHGLAFEEILRPCGLFPEQITLEINIDGIEDTDHLSRAITNYRSRGYSIAVSHVGRNRLDFELLKALQPDIVKLDQRTIAAPDSLKQILGNLHQLPSRIMIASDSSRSLQKLGLEGEVDLLQAQKPLRKLLHAVAVTRPGNWESSKNAA